jgi:3-phosphoshikimate 1-carboxyvinyltransferase
VKISKPNSDKITGIIQLVSSKSESNRALIIQAICDETITIKNLSTSDDTNTLKSLLGSYKNNNVLDAHHAGTTYRFLVAFLSCQIGEWTLTGSERMKERPIKILVETLRENGAKIDYLEKDGYPPLLIKGSNLDLSNIQIDGSISSQYISALLLLGPSMVKATKISFIDRIISKPYINMTLAIMEYFGAKTKWENGSILIEKTPYKTNSLSIESDWSAASYWYQIVSLNNDSSVVIEGLKKQSFQGDSEVANVFKQLGVDTIYKENSISISKENSTPSRKIELNLNNTPDLAQTIICTCAGLGIEATISGLETLVIKETNRLEALKNELQKFSVDLEIIENHTLYLKGGQTITNPTSSIETYNDHRMAMAFAPLSLVVGSFKINNPEVVSKSYPNYWEDLRSVGFKIQY